MIVALAHNDELQELRRVRTELNILRADVEDLIAHKVLGRCAVRQCDTLEKHHSTHKCRKCVSDTFVLNV